MSQILQENSALVATAGAATMTRRADLGDYDYPRGVDVRLIAVTANSDGAASVKVPDLCGKILRVSIIHGTGDDAPTTLYDVTLTDENGVDVLMGGGANLDTSAAAKTFWPENTSQNGNGSLMAVAGDHTLAAANMGDANKFTLAIYTAY